MELRRKLRETQSELTLLLAKEAKALKSKSKSGTKVGSRMEQEVTTKVDLLNKAGDIQLLIETQRERLSEESSKQVERGHNETMEVEAIEGRDDVPVEIVPGGNEYMEKNMDEVSSQLDCHDDVAQVNPASHNFLSQEKAKEIVLVENPLTF